MLMNSELKLPRMVASPNCHCYQIQVSSLYSHFLFQLETDSTLDPEQLSVGVQVIAFPSGSVAYVPILNAVLKGMIWTASMSHTPPLV